MSDYKPNLIKQNEKNKYCYKYFLTILIYGNRFGLV